MAFASDSSLARLAEQLLSTVECFVAGQPDNLVS